MVQQDEAKWKCGSQGCTKMFKAPEFLQKHLLNKHGDELDNSLRIVRTTSTPLPRVLLL